MSEREHAPYGVYHFAGAGQASWFEFATAIIDLAGKRLSGPPEVLPIPTRDYPTPAICPLDTRLIAVWLQRISILRYSRGNMRSRIRSIVC